MGVLSSFGMRRWVLFRSTSPLTPNMHAMPIQAVQLPLQANSRHLGLQFSSTCSHAKSAHDGLRPLIRISSRACCPDTVG